MVDYARISDLILGDVQKRFQGFDGTIFAWEDVLVF